MTADVTSGVGFWAALRSGWRGFVPVVLGHAVLQGLLVLGDPTPEATWSFALRALVSVLAILVLVWLVVCWARVAADSDRRSGWSLARRRPAVLAWAAGLGVVAFVAVLVHLYLTPVALLLAAFVLPQVAAAASRPVPRAFETVRQAPLRTVLSVLAFTGLLILGWVVALLLGFFVTGVLAAVVTWLWFGASTVVLACVFTALADATAPVVSRLTGR